MFDPGLRERLDLLQRSGQVDSDVAAFVTTWLGRVSAALGFNVNDSDAGAFVTHTALALQRARRGEAIEKWSADHSAELADAPESVRAADRLVSEALDELGIRLPVQERDFVALHLAAASLKAKGARCS
jgi:mannitol operon transcriptional antiterminator